MTSWEYEPSYIMPEETDIPPHTPVDDAADKFDWNGCDVPVDPSEGLETPGDMPHPNPFIYEGAGPANVGKRKNVIFFGEVGVGKSSVINLMAGTEVAETSSNLGSCTMHATEYAFTLSGEMSKLYIYDIAGLDEPKMDRDTFVPAIEKAYRLITSLHDAGGVDLLLFCIRGNRITTTTQSNYRLFFEFTCGKKVPLAIVVTSLEFEDVMEDWWRKNEKQFDDYGIQSVAHACITAIPPHSLVLAEKRERKWEESRNALQRMLHDSLSLNSTPYMKDVKSWLANVIDKVWSFLMENSPPLFRKRFLSWRLRTRCSLSPDEAERLADMFMSS